MAGTLQFCLSSPLVMPAPAAERPYDLSQVTCTISKYNGFCTKSDHSYLTWTIYDAHLHRITITFPKKTSVHVSRVVVWPELDRDWKGRFQYPGQ